MYRHGRSIDVLEIFISPHQMRQQVNNFLEIVEIVPASLIVRLEPQHHQRCKAVASHAGLSAVCCFLPQRVEIELRIELSQYMLDTGDPGTGSSHLFGSDEIVRGNESCLSLLALLTALYADIIHVSPLHQNVGPAGQIHQVLRRNLLSAQQADQRGHCHPHVNPSLTFLGDSGQG